MDVTLLLEETGEIIHACGSSFFSSAVAAMDGETDELVMAVETIAVCGLFFSLSSAVDLETDVSVMAVVDAADVAAK